MPLLTSLLVLIICARLLGGLFVRFGQPEIVGEMVAGVLLGPAIFNIIHANEPLKGISELAVFFVIVSAGLEMNFRDIISVIRSKGIILALLAFIIPLGSGILVGIIFQLDAMRTIFLGLCISITALPVAVRILESFKLLNSDIAKYSVATAIVNDLVALLALGVILGLPEQNSFQATSIAIFITSGKLILLMSCIVGVNWLLENIQKRGLKIETIPEKIVAAFGSEALFGIVMLFALVFASISELLGFHFVIGAFFGALLIDKSFFFEKRYLALEKTVGSITAGFLAPVFFAYLGLEFNFSELGSALFVATVLFISVASKILSGWVGGRMIHLSNNESLGIGIILNGRGVMELVVAQIALHRGFIGQGLFSTLVLMGVVTTMLTPILFKYIIIPRLLSTPIPDSETKRVTQW